MTKNAIATLAIGPAYIERFELHCRKGWTAYAARHGFDVVVIKEPLDASERAMRRNPSWQKCLMLGAPGLSDYDRVVWVDADICINPNAPSILDGVPAERIGAIDEHAYPSPELRQTILDAIIASSPAEGAFGARYWREWCDPGVWHEAVGLPSGQAHIVQAGVLVLSPAHHRELLEQVYHSHDDAGPNYEMRALSYAIQARGLQHWIDPRFNALIWWLYLAESLSGATIATPDELSRFVRETYRRSYFLHFAGAAQLMALLDSPAE